MFSKTEVLCRSIAFLCLGALIYATIGDVGDFDYLVENVFCLSSLFVAGWLLIVTWNRSLDVKIYFEDDDDILDILRGNKTFRININGNEYMVGHRGTYEKLKGESDVFKV